MSRTATCQICRHRAAPPSGACLRRSWCHSEHAVSVFVDLDSVPRASEASDVHCCLTPLQPRPQGPTGTSWQEVQPLHARQDRRICCSWRPSKRAACLSGRPAAPTLHRIINLKNCSSGAWPWAPPCRRATLSTDSWLLLRCCRRLPAGHQLRCGGNISPSDNVTTVTAHVPLPACRTSAASTRPGARV